MASFLTSKWSTTVIALVFTLVGPQGFAGKDDQGDPRSAAIYTTADQVKEANSRLVKINEECKSVREKAQKEKAGALAACRESRKKLQETKIDKIDEKDRKDENINAARASIEACSKEFDECLNQGKDELDTNSILSGMSMYPGANTMAGLIPEINDTAKKCSKLSRADWNSALEKARSSLESSQEKFERSQDKKSRGEKEAQDDHKKSLKEFMEAQEKKTEADLKNKENDRNQQAAYDKQRAEYKSKADQIQMEIFTIQQQQSLLLRTKGEATDQFNMDVQSCRRKANEEKSKSKGVSSNLVTASVSNTIAEWRTCINISVRKREQATEIYKGKMRQLEMSFEMKNRELAALEDSASRMAKMFEEAKADQKKNKEDSDQQFLSRQQTAWINMDSQLKNAQNENARNQQLLELADRQVNEKSKRVAMLEAEEPETKSADDIIASTTMFEHYLSSAAKVCVEDRKIAQKEVEDAENKAKAAREEIIKGTSSATDAKPRPGN